MPVKKKNKKQKYCEGFCHLFG